MVQAGYAPATVGLTAAGHASAAVQQELFAIQLHEQQLQLRRQQLLEHLQHNGQSLKTSTVPAAGTGPAAAATSAADAAGPVSPALDWSSMPDEQKAQLLAAAADAAAAQQYAPGGGPLPVVLEDVAAQVTILDSMPRDVSQLLAWPTVPSAAAAAVAAPGAGAFQQQYMLSLHNHCGVGQGSRRWLPRHDGHVQHTVLTANSPTPQAVTFQVSYDTGGPQSWTVDGCSEGLGLAKLKGKAVVTVSAQQAAAGSKGKRRRGGKSGSEPLCTVEVGFERVIALRQPQQQQQQCEQASGYWRPYTYGSQSTPWLMGCVALNTFTGTVLGVKPADQSLPVIIAGATAGASAVQPQLAAAPFLSATMSAPAAAPAAAFGVLPAAPVWLHSGSLPAAALPSSTGLHNSQPMAAAAADDFNPAGQAAIRAAPPSAAAAWGGHSAQQQLIGEAARSAQLQPAVGSTAAAGVLPVQLEDAYVDDPDIQDLLRQILEDPAEDRPAEAEAAGAAPALADTCKVAAGMPFALGAADTGPGGFAAAAGAVAGAAVAVHVSAGGSAGAGSVASAPAAAAAGATEAAGQDSSSKSFLQHVLGLVLYTPGTFERIASGLLLAGKAPPVVQWPVPRVDVCAQPGLLSSLRLSSAAVSLGSSCCSRQWQDDGWQQLWAVCEGSSEGVVRSLVLPTPLPAGGLGALSELLLTDVTVSASSAAAATTAVASAAAAGPPSRATMAGPAGTVGWQLVVDCLVQLFVLQAARLLAATWLGAFWASGCWLQLMLGQQLSQQLKLLLMTQGMRCGTGASSSSSATCGMSASALFAGVVGVLEGEAHGTGTARTGAGTTAAAHWGLLQGGQRSACPRAALPPPAVSVPWGHLGALAQTAC